MFNYVSVFNPGGSEALEIKQGDIPKPKEDQVRIKVEAAGVAFPDIYFRTGTMVPPDIYPITPGYDAVGIVDKLGQDVKGLKLGQRVIRVSSVGGYAEILCHRASDLVSVPENLDAGVAVSVGLNGVMAYQMVHRMGRVVKGNSVLVHGAGGGIGHLIVQLCVLAGATVYGVGSTNKQETIKSMGAVPIDYQKEDVESRVKELTDGKGMDVVFDGIGPKAHWDQSYKLTSMFGRLVMFGMMGAINRGVPDRDIFKDLMENPKSWSSNDLISSNISIAFYSFSTMKIDRPDLFREDLSKMLSLAARNKIKPIIGARFKLDEVRQAHELLHAAAVPGKILLDMRT